jgi:hypothetical protein
LQRQFTEHPAQFQDPWGDTPRRTPGHADET